MGKGNWLVFGVIIVAAVIVWFNWNPNSPESASGWLGGETTFDFGDVAFAGGLVEHTFNLVYQGDSPATIEDMFSNCGCTEAELSHGLHQIGPYGMAGHGSSMVEMGMHEGIDWSIEPGDELAVKVTFDPAAHGEDSIGDSVERKVTIKTDQGDGVMTFAVHIV